MTKSSHRSDQASWVGAPTVPPPVGVALCAAVIVQEDDDGTRRIRRLEVDSDLKRRLHHAPTTTLSFGPKKDTYIRLVLLKGLSTKLKYLLKCNAVGLQKIRSNIRKRIANSKHADVSK